MSETRSAVSPTAAKPQASTTAMPMAAPEPSRENAAHAAALRAAYERGHAEGFEKGYAEGIIGQDVLVGEANSPLAPKGLVTVFNLNGDAMHINPTTIRAHKDAGWYLAEELPLGSIRQRPPR